ncbi:MAG: response regulator [bacterium]
MPKSENASKVLDILDTKVNRNFALSASVCVHCGMCTESCHYYVATRDPKMSPTYKADKVRSLYKRRHDWLSRIVPRWTGAKNLQSDEELDELMDVVFGSCTMCRRCTMNCPMGVDTALLMRSARASLCAIGKMPEGVVQVCHDQYETGNQMAVSHQDYIETIEWLSEEHANDVGDPKAVIPLDKKGADVMYVVNPREVKFAPLTLLAAAKIMYAAGESWTMPSDGWDNTNFGLFAGDDKLGAQMGRRLFEKAKELRVKKVVVSECGHGFRATRWEAPNWAKMDLDFPIESFLETMTNYIKESRITVDPSRNKARVTYHDPCNLGRSAGLTEEPRFLLQHCVQNFVEMYPNRADNWCCSGGGGAMSMAEYNSRRIEVARVKADQLRTTGAKIVATACHNCIDGLSDLIRKYDLGMKTATVGELLAEALVMPKALIPEVADMFAAAGIRPIELTPGEPRKKILVIDDEADVRTYLVTLFEDFGYDTIEAPDANQGMRMIKQYEPDLITLDIIMPKKTGIKLYMELRKEKQYDAIPVIVVTGFAEPEYPNINVEKFISERRHIRPPEGFIQKPINPVDLMKNVQEAIHAK